MNNYLKNKLIENGFINSKNLLNGKKVLILSCGPNIEKFKNIIELNNEKYIIVSIKTATCYSDTKEDFFFYDERLYDGFREEYKYSINNNSIKILCKSLYQNEYEYYNYKFNHNIEFCVDSITEPFLIEPDNFQFKKSVKKNKIYYNVNLFFPIYLKVLMFFIYLGVSDFDLFGIDWYNEDVTPQVKHFMIKHFKNKKPRFIGFDNLLGSFYSNIFLKNLKDKYNLKLKLFTEFSQVDIEIPRIDLNNNIFYQKSNYYKYCEDIIINDNELNNNYNLLFKICKSSHYIDTVWYKILLLMISNIKDYSFKKLNKKWISNLDKHINGIKFGDPLFSIGCAIGM